jgi:hypothetical protein
MALRINALTGARAEVTEEAARMHDRIIELQRKFDDDAPWLDSPEFKEWDGLRAEFRERWPEAWMVLLD